LLRSTTGFDLLVNVLASRLQQLSSERGPITAHIEGLEKHITAMYEELIDVFDEKKSTDKVVEAKEKKIALLQHELKTLTVTTKQYETLIHSFKRDVGNIVSSNAGGKTVEEAMRTLYKKYVRGEKVSEESLKATGGLHDAVHHFVTHTTDDSHGRERGAFNQGEALMHQIRAAQGHPPQPQQQQQQQHQQHSTNQQHYGHSNASAGHATAGGGHNTANGTGNTNGRGQVKEIEEALIESAKEAERQKG
jgi:hypothetical protein